MIVVLADDLTGAAELAGVGWRAALKSEVLCLGNPLGDSALACVDLNSRLVAEAEAARRVRCALQDLTRRNPAWVYKKMDSVLRGHVVAEVSEVMRWTGAKRAIVVSANPSLGRTVRDGAYYVKGVPLAETDFRLDPQYPRWTSRVADLLGQGAMPVRVLKPGSQLPEEGLLVGEASSQEDLAWWASVCDNATVVAGAAEFFAALLGARGNQVPAVHPGTMRQQTGELALFVCGSASSPARDFLTRCRAQRVPVVGLPSEAMHDGWGGAPNLAKKAEAFLRGTGRAVLAIDLPLASQAGAGERLLEALVGAAERVLRGIGVETPLLLAVDGGATAAALWTRMGWGPMRVEAELAQGVVALRPRGGGQTRVAVKPGSYEWPVPW